MKPYTFDKPKCHHRDCLKKTSLYHGRSYHFCPNHYQALPPELAKQLAQMVKYASDDDYAVMIGPMLALCRSTLYRQEKDQARKAAKQQAKQQQIDADKRARLDEHIAHARRVVTQRKASNRIAALSKRT
jgi:hypothetical protein